MKAIYRAKFNALSAMNDGYSFITIKRYNKTVCVWLDEIISTTNGQKVQEYGMFKCESLRSECLTYRQLMNYNK